MRVCSNTHWNLSFECAMWDNIWPLTVDIPCGRFPAIGFGDLGWRRLPGKRERRPPTHGSLHSHEHCLVLFSLFYVHLYFEDTITEIGLSRVFNVERTGSFHLGVSQSQNYQLHTVLCCAHQQSAVLCCPHWENACGAGSQSRISEWDVPMLCVKCGAQIIDNGPIFLCM